MGGGNEQRVAITFCFKAGLSATETLLLVQKAYGNEALNRSNEKHDSHAPQVRQYRSHGVKRRRRKYARILLFNDAMCNVTSSSDRHDNKLPTLDYDSSWM
jgi:hypothetical protein